MHVWTQSFEPGSSEAVERHEAMTLIAQSLQEVQQRIKVVAIQRGWRQGEPAEVFLVQQGRLDGTALGRLVWVNNHHLPRINVAALEEVRSWRDSAARLRQRILDALA